jgi:hypothetical protein
MKTIFILGLLVLFNSCKSSDTNEPGVCQPPMSLLAQSTCDSGYQGTFLIASDYKYSKMPEGSMLFEVFPQKDTSSSDINVKAWKNGSNQRERILISDAVIGNAPKFLVQVSINCSGTELKSKYFAFVKRPATDRGCFVWQQQ